MKITERVAARIRKLREERQLTQEQLAWKSELNRTFMNDVENARRNISLETLDKILSGLETSFAEFFADSVFENGKRRKK